VKLVLDTNVLISAVLTAHGTCARIVDLLAEGALDLYVDDRILAEYTAVLQRPELRIVPEDAAILLELVRSVAHPVAGRPLPVRLPDSNDEAFLEVAAASNAVLVTGNLRHYPRSSRGQVTVLTPAELLEVLRRGGQ
jgi:putative PIN family toxin of toxin-antitoxin system